MPRLTRPILFSALAAVLIITLPVAILTVYPQAGCGSYGPGISAQEARGKSQQELANLMAERWLESYTTQRWFSFPDYRIKDYTIHSVGTVGAVTEDTSDLFISSVSFDVQRPGFFLGQSWAAGNGIETADGWIRHKFLFLSIRKDDAGYHIESTATGI